MACGYDPLEELKDIRRDVEEEKGKGVLKG